MSEHIDTRPVTAGAGPVVAGHRIARGTQHDLDATEALSTLQATEHGDRLIRQPDGSHIIVNEHHVPQPEPVRVNEVGVFKYE